MNRIRKSLVIGASVFVTLLSTAPVDASELPPPPACNTQGDWSKVNCIYSTDYEDGCNDQTFPGYTFYCQTKLAEACPTNWYLWTTSGFDSPLCRNSIESTLECPAAYINENWEDATGSLVCYYWLISLHYGE